VCRESQSVELYTSDMSFLKYIILCTKYLSGRESPCNLVLLIKKKSDDRFGGSSGIYRKDGRSCIRENDDDDCETCAKCEASCAECNKLSATILIERTATTTTIVKCVRGVIRGRRSRGTRK